MRTELVPSKFSFLSCTCCWSASILVSRSFQLLLWRPLRMPVNQKYQMQLRCHSQDHVHMGKHHLPATQPYTQPQLQASLLAAHTLCFSTLYAAADEAMHYQYMCTTVRHVSGHSFGWDSLHIMLTAPICFFTFSKQTQHLLLCFCL